MNPLLMVLLLLYLFAGGTVNLAQSENRYQYDYKKNIFITLFTTVGTVAFTFLFLIFIKENRYYAKILGFVVPAILLAGWIFISELQKKAFCINFEYWKYGLRISLPLVFHTISLNILTQSDRIIINKFCGNDAAGVYSLIYQYAMLVNIILNAINESWNPTYHEKKYNSINTNIMPLNAFVAYVCIGCITVGPEAILILGGEQYLSGKNCIAPIVLGLMAQFLFSHYIILEVHHKETQYTSFGTIVAASINLVLNIIFVPIFGFTAAAYTTLIAYLVLYLIHLFITKKMLKINLYQDFKLFMWFIIVGVYAGVSNMLYSSIIPRYLLLIFVTIIFALIFKKDILSKLRRNNV